MRPPLSVIVSALALAAAAAGCGEPVPPLVAADKARFVTELIVTLPACDAFRQRLGAAALELAAIDRIYSDARSAGCIKKDI